MVRWMKMPLDVEVGLAPGHIVFSGDPAPPKGHSSPELFGTMSVVAKQLDGSRCHLVQR